MRSFLQKFFILFITVISMAGAPALSQDTLSLDGLDMRNPAHPSDGVYTGGQPSEDDLKKLAAAGVTTVINFRSADEMKDFDEEAFVTALGMEYIHIPIAQASDMNDTSVAAFAEAMNGSDGNVFVHCASSNRVGAMMALKAHGLDGMNHHDALDFGKTAGMKSLTSVVEERFDHD